MMPEPTIEEALFEERVNGRARDDFGSNDDTSSTMDFAQPEHERRGRKLPRMPRNMLPQPFNDYGNGQRFVAMHGEVAR
jgi:hypothetical protein